MEELTKAIEEILESMGLDTNDPGYEIEYED